MTNTTTDPRQIAACLSHMPKVAARATGLTVNQVRAMVIREPRSATWLRRAILLTAAGRDVPGA